MSGDEVPPTYESVPSKQCGSSPRTKPFGSSDYLSNAYLPTGVSNSKGLGNLRLRSPYSIVRDDASSCEVSRQWTFRCVPEGVLDRDRRKDLRYYYRSRLGRFL